MPMHLNVSAGLGFDYRSYWQNYRPYWQTTGRLVGAHSQSLRRGQRISDRRARQGGVGDAIRVLRRWLYRAIDSRLHLQALKTATKSP